ncbi:hypothetical protein [Kitasatospora sp. McL0602]|uniref:hypothetical protein n=1 Tax=Kitasatospora sp. McL0602 TaxID=3439530 RepID=UPI003F8AD9D6
MLRKTAGAGLLAALGATMLLGATGAEAAGAAPASPDVMPQPSAHLANTDVGAGLKGTSSALGYAVAPFKSLRLDPFAQSSADVLNNGVSVEPDHAVAPVSTAAVTGPLSDGGGVQDLMGVGPALGLLPG